jgi:hypothetical protein
MTRSQLPSTTREPIECLSKVLDGTFVTCGLGIGRGPDVVFRVSFIIAIMSLVLNFKSWKLNNDVFTSFLSHFMHLKLTLHKLISGKLCVFLMYMYSLDTRIWCPSSLSCNNIFPLANKVRSSSVLKGQKDYGMSARALLALVIGLELDASPSVWITCLMVEILGATLASFATKYEV